MGMFDNIKFPFLTHQQLNLDWILNEIKRVMGFFPESGDPGTVLMKTEDGTAWEELAAVDININGVPEDTELTDTDKLIFYDVSSSANRKITAPNLLNSMMSNGSPLMDGTASAGTSKKPARYDHRHPTDTSRQAALSGTQMNAVNSGAPANSFNSGVLRLEHGGTSGSTAGQAAKNMRVLTLGEVLEKIPENGDFNTYIVPGEYVVITSDIANSLSNIPIRKAGILRVFSAMGAPVEASSTWKYLIQEYITYTGVRYQRHGESGDGAEVTWNDWEQIYTSADFVTDGSGYLKLRT